MKHVKPILVRIALTLLALLAAWLLLTRGTVWMDPLARNLDDLQSLRVFWAALWAAGVWVAMAFIWGTE